MRILGLCSSPSGSQSKETKVCRLFLRVTVFHSRITRVEMGIRGRLLSATAWATSLFDLDFRCAFSLS